MASLFSSFGGTPAASGVWTGTGFDYNNSTGSFTTVSTLTISRVATYAMPILIQLDWGSSASSNRSQVSMGGTGTSVRCELNLVSSSTGNLGSHIFGQSVGVSGLRNLYLEPAGFKWIDPTPANGGNTTYTLTARILVTGAGGTVSMYRCRLIAYEWGG